MDEQLRDILESNVTTVHDDSLVFRQARDQYEACMNLERLEDIGKNDKLQFVMILSLKYYLILPGLTPLLEILKKFGGWPVVEGDSWDEASFDWRELIYKYRLDNHSDQNLCLK